MINRTSIRSLLRFASIGIPQRMPVATHLPFQFCSQKKLDALNQLKKTMQSLSSKTGSGSSVEMSTVYFQLGELYLKFNAEKESTEHFEKGAQIMIQAFGEKNQQHIKYLQKYYRIMHTASKLEKCVEIYLRILNLLEPTSFRYLQSMNQIAALYCYMKKYDEAQKWLDKGYKVHKQLWSDRLDIKFLMQSAHAKMEYERKNFAKAYDLFKNCAELYETHGNKDWLVPILENVYFLMATIELEINKDKELALKNVKKAKQWINKSDMSLYQSYHNIRRFYLVAGEKEEFRNTTLEEISIIKERFGRNENYALVCKELGQNYLQHKQHEEALKWFEQCGEIQQKLGKEKNYASTLYGIATCKIQNSKFEEAINSVKECLDIHSRLSESSYGQKASLKTVLGQLYSKLNNRQQTIKYFESALEDEKKIKRPQETYNLHKFLISLFYTKENKNEELRKCLNHVLQCERIGRQELKLGEGIQTNIVPVLTEILIRLKDVEKAWPFLQRQKKQLEKLFSNDKHHSKWNEYWGKVGFYYHCVGDTQKAVETFEGIIKSLKEKNLPPTVISAYENILESLKANKKI